MNRTIEPLTPQHWPALENLFGKAGASNGCWCMYWRLGPRYRDRVREHNRRDRQHLTTADRPPGLVAFEADVAVGWCELAPRSELAWLASARHLAPVDDVAVWSIPCFYVRRTHRRRGVTSALTGAAIEEARRAGAPVLEAYPVDTTVPGHTTNLFPGIASTFTKHGFEEVARRKHDRPIMRHPYN